MNNTEQCVDTRRIGRRKERLCSSYGVLQGAVREKLKDILVGFHGSKASGQEDRRVGFKVNIRDWQMLGLFRWLSISSCAEQYRREWLTWDGVHSRRD